MHIIPKENTWIHKRKREKRLGPYTKRPLKLAFGSFTLSFLSNSLIHKYIYILSTSQTPTMTMTETMKRRWISHPSILVKTPRTLTLKTSLSLFLPFWVGWLVGFSSFSAFLLCCPVYSSSSSSLLLLLLLSLALISEANFASLPASLNYNRETPAHTVWSFRQSFSNLSLPLSESFSFSPSLRIPLFIFAYSNGALFSHKTHPFSHVFCTTSVSIGLWRFNFENFLTMSIRIIRTILYWFYYIVENIKIYAKLYKSES